MKHSHELSVVECMVRTCVAMSRRVMVYRWPMYFVRVWVGLALTWVWVGGTVETSWAVLPEGWRPIDQAVGDLDPLSESHRQVEVGLRDNGEQTSLFQVTTPGPRAGLEQNAFYRIGPGFRVRVERLEYLVFDQDGQVQFNQSPYREGQFLELIGANAQYELSPEPILPQPVLYVPSEALINGRLDHAGTSAGGGAMMSTDQIDARVDGRVGGRLE